MGWMLQRRSAQRRAREGGRASSPDVLHASLCAAAGISLFILLAAAAPFAALDDDGLQARRRRLAKLPPDDPVIDTPYGEASNRWLVFLHVIGIMYMLIGLNTVCDLYFTGSLDVMVLQWNIKPDVAGATFMAAGGSAPELFTSLIGATITEDDVGFSTIVGSAVFNVLFVIGLCGFASADPIKLSWWPLFRDCAFYILGLLLLAVFAEDGEIRVWEAGVLFINYLAYLVFMYHNAKMEALTDFEFLKARSEAPSDLVRKGGAEVNMDRIVPIPTSEKATLSDASPASPTGTGGNSSSSEASNARLTEAVANVNGSICTPGEVPPVPVRVENNFMPADVDESSQPQLVQSDASSAAIPTKRSSAKLVHGTKMHAALFTGHFAHQRHTERMASVANFSSGEISVPQSPKEQEEEEGDDIEELLLRPEGLKDQIVWYICLPVYVCLYFGLPKPTEKWFMATFGLSLIWIAGLTFFLVWWTSILGEVLHINIVVMGFTLLAAGTSIPDAVSSVAVARNGQGDMAVSSSVGSNIFDILVGLPVPWMLKILLVEGDTDVVIKLGSEYLTFYVMVLLFMVFSTIICIHLLGWRLNRPLGICMALLYVVFLVTAVYVDTSQPSWARI